MAFIAIVDVALLTVCQGIIAIDHVDCITVRRSKLAAHYVAVCTIREEYVCGKLVLQVSSVTLQAGTASRRISVHLPSRLQFCSSRLTYNPWSSNLQDSA